MADISLSAAVRSNLLSLKNTSDLIGRTQERLSTGLKINSPIDDAKVFFEAKALNDRAATLSEKKDAIDQSVSSVNRCSRSRQRDRLHRRSAEGHRDQRAVGFHRGRVQRTECPVQLADLPDRQRRRRRQLPGNQPGQRHRHQPDGLFQRKHDEHAGDRLGRPDQRIHGPGHHDGRHAQCNLAEHLRHQPARLGHRHLECKGQDARLERRAAADAPRLHRELRQRARDRCRQASSCRHHRRGCQPGGAADASAARDLRPVLRRTGRTVGPVAVQLGRTDHRVSKGGFGPLFLCRFFAAGRSSGGRFFAGLWLSTINHIVFKRYI